MFIRENLPYRQNSLGYVVNDEGKFLLVNKESYEDNQWSFPGGGIDEGETAEQALLRELKEELMTNNFKIIRKSQNVYQYEWPDEVIETSAKKKGKYFRGQQLIQFLVRFTGNNAEVKPGDGIRMFKWVSRNDLPSHLVFPNQLENAEGVLNELLKA